MSAKPVGYFRLHDGAWQQTIYHSLEEWYADKPNFAECDWDDTPPTPLYDDGALGELIEELDAKCAEMNREIARLRSLYAVEFDKKYGTPCQQIEYQQEIDRLQTALADIVRRYEFRSELYIDDATCAGTLYDTARIALGLPNKEQSK